LQRCGLELDRYWFTRKIEPRPRPPAAYVVRPATAADATRMSQLSGGGRTAFPEIGRENTLVLVCEEVDQVQGYVIGLIVPTPAVYDPGGLTALVLEFVVAGADAGQTLLHHLEETAQQQSAVVCARDDQVKQTMLKQQEYTVASEWYIGAIA
jgi:hypothetical protein